MKLSELKEIWGIPINILHKYRKKYIISLAICYLLDMVIFAGVMWLMLVNKVSSTSSVICLLVVCLSFTMFSSLINKDKAQACTFYRKHKNDKVIESYYNIDSTRLYSVLYCSGCKRVKPDKAISYYLDLIISLCSEDYINASRIMKYLSKYQVENCEDYNLSLNIINNKRKQYFVAVINESEDLEDENNEE